MSLIEWHESLVRRLECVTGASLAPWSRECGMKGGHYYTQDLSNASLKMCAFEEISVGLWFQSQSLTPTNIMNSAMPGQRERFEFINYTLLVTGLLILRRFQSPADIKYISTSIPSPLHSPSTPSQKSVVPRLPTKHSANQLQLPYPYRDFSDSSQCLSKQVMIKRYVRCP